MNYFSWLIDSSIRKGNKWKNDNNQKKMMKKETNCFHFHRISRWISISIYRNFFEFLINCNGYRIPVITLICITTVQINCIYIVYLCWFELLLIIYKQSPNCLHLHSCLLRGYGYLLCIWRNGVSLENQLINK